MNMAADLLNLEPWWRFGVALVIGALIGVEREFIQQKTGEPDFAGVRTFSLITLLGAVTAFLSDEFTMWPFALVLVGLILLTVASYVGALMRSNEDEGITTEIAALLAFLLGAMVAWDRAEVAIALAVITALLLSLKGRLHNVVRRMSAEDLRVTLEFGLVAAVVLPLLPNRAIDPLGVVNLRSVWLLVVLVSGIGFVGYVLMKVLGAERGIGLAALLGGLASSTATTLSFSTRSKETPILSDHFARAILIASSVMFPRVVVEVLAVYPALLGRIIIPLGVMLTGGLVVILYLWRKHKGSDDHDDEQSVEVSNPLKLSTAVMFGLVFAVVLIVVKLAEVGFGDAGVYVAAFVTGLTDVDAITLSAAGLARSGELAPQVAGTAIVIASVMNTAAKAGIAYTVGSTELRRIIVRAFAVIVVLGVISGGLVFLLW